MRIQLAIAADLPELTDLFRQTVLAHGPQHYTAAQTQAWATLDPERFRQLILGVTTFVAVDDTGMLGFAGLGDDGHVASVYVRRDRLHQGIGTALLTQVLDHARSLGMARLYGEASHFSLGLFQKFGFQLDGTEAVDRQGVLFERYLVSLTLSRDNSL
ncbi:MAG: GNAT family N-acetyltransferase [Cyanobacteria bacterium]|nr:GNAT family N-acetyltransferase [Cyanobacteriota bacterium]MDA0864982.1 GNAT family N-acetyltransferase [Cyanobacteriota bacterium]